MNDSHKKVVMKPAWPKVPRYSSPEEILLETPSDEEEERCMSITHPPTPPTREMSRLSLQSSRVRKAVRPTSAPSAVIRSARSAPLPTWGQMKKLIQVAEHRLQEGRLPKTEVNLMLSMMAVLTVTRTPWSEVRAHLLGHTPNLSVDIQQLQQEIDQMSSANLQLLPGEEALSSAAEGLSTLNPLTWIKSLGGGFADRQDDDRDDDDDNSNDNNHSNSSLLTKKSRYPSDHVLSRSIFWFEEQSSALVLQLVKMLA
ncbi:uncharacterized protein RBU33_017732 [Hipposideros larvatus]